MGKDKTDEAASSPSGDSPLKKEVLAELERVLRGLKFGTVTISVQDGVVVQIDRTEKVRLR